MDARQTTIFTAILIASVLIGVILTYFIITIIRHQRKNQELYKSKILAEITTLEKERKRMAADLHDELGPILAGIKMKLSSLDVHEKDDQVTLERVQQNINEMMGKMKEISNDLMPVILIKKGFVAAMESSVDDINRSRSFQVQFIHKDIPSLPEHTAINLFRIFQEILHNTIKHSGAQNLRIEMKMNKNNLTILTEDNGSGFNYHAETTDHSGLGLRNLLNRTEVLGGNMYIDSEVGKGTRYTFEVPL